MRPHLFLAAAHRDEERLLAHADAASDKIERAVQQVWAELIAVLEANHNGTQIIRRAIAILARLQSLVAPLVHQSLTDAVKESHAWVRTSAPRRRRNRVEDEFPNFSLADDVLLPAISSEQVNAIVYSTGWEQRLATLTRLANPQVLAAQLAQALGEGATPRQAAAIIQPAVQGVQTSARRIARHEAVRVAHEARFAAYESLGDMILGYTIHAVLDSNTRPEHRRRDGQQYFREPTGGRLGLDRMPRPPMEADGSVAFNCRCYLTPIFDA